MSERTISKVRRFSERAVGLARRVRDYPGEWFRSEVDQALAKGEISAKKAEIFHQQVDDPRAFQQIADVFHCTVTARILSYPISAAIGWYGVTYDQPELVAYSVMTHIPFIPQVSVTGMQRFVYLAGRIGYDWLTEKDRSKLPHPLTEVTALVLAPLKPWGNGSALARANKSTAEVSLFATKALAGEAAKFLQQSQPNNYNLPTIYRATF